MTRLEAFRILGLENGADADAVKKAYKRRAFETHPDRGGSAAEFLKVQVAYEILSADRNGAADGELDSVLLDRLDSIHEAFVRLGADADQFCEQTFNDFDRYLIAKITGYRSYDVLRSQAENDIRYLWSWTVGRIATFLEDQVGQIADSHEEWLQEYLKPVVEAAKSQNPPRWFEREVPAALIAVGSLLSGGIALYFGDWWLAIPALPIAAFVVTLPVKYRRRFDSKRIITGIELQDLKGSANLSRLDIERNWIGSENAAFGAGGVGAAFGALVLGPVGAIVGGALGAVFGWLVGESLDERKQKLYDSVVENINRVLPTMIDELNRRLSATEEAMMRAIRENFNRNVRAVAALMKG